MIAFVILHYLDEESTVTCVNNIKNLQGEHLIVVVDNASPNNSGRNLFERYMEDSMVTVLFSSENTGFARGNNMGVCYAQSHGSPEFVVVLNNDVEILQKNFCSRIKEIYEQKPFDLLGPDIISQFSGTHQSPKRLSSITLETGRGKAAYVRRSQNPVLMYLSSGEKSNTPLYRRVIRYRRKKSGID